MVLVDAQAIGTAHEQFLDKLYYLNCIISVFAFCFFKKIDLVFNEPVLAVPPQPL